MKNKQKNASSQSAEQTQASQGWCSSTACQGAVVGLLGAAAGLGLLFLSGDPGSQSSGARDTLRELLGKAQETSRSTAENLLEEAADYIPRSGAPNFPPPGTFPGYFPPGL